MLGYNALEYVDVATACFSIRPSCCVCVAGALMWRLQVSLLGFFHLHSWFSTILHCNVCTDLHTLKVLHRSYTHIDITFLSLIQLVV